MTSESFEERKRLLNECALVFEAEERRLKGEPSFSTQEVRMMLKDRHYLRTTLENEKVSEKGDCPSVLLGGSKK